ncbi:serine/threonine-protein kinase VRK1-like isoform X2 [Venturia canescens]|uniref:serine/threonine-protein kinase VRK1-like isoform X2 n=1 Tax=Venturia canescens TaxID=32260 RepID=UPI001C9C49DD|nr:serine/threonine-protein kinase VRK1-like isoform X2 [Venturia canescens]
MVTMTPRRAEEPSIKRVAAFGCRLPTRLPAGEILTDITQKQWKLGNTIGCGGFGDIYLASNNIHENVSDNAEYVIKIEPHNNGPLFVEMNFYIRAARKQMIDGWCESQGIERIGVPTHEGSGSHVYQGERYRFLVIPRYGTDVGKLFLSRGRKLPMKVVNGLAIQMLDALEYIHSRGYAHSDVKGSNIMLDLDDQDLVTDNFRAYLVDYGLAYRFRTRAGSHKPFVHDERRAHEGTLEFTSRDAHDGTHSRRGDMETLGYNLLQWLCGRLPWEQETGGMATSINPEEVQAQKEIFLSDIPLLMRECFPKKKKPPAAIMTYMKYIAALEFEEKPNYTSLRNLFRLDNDEKISKSIHAKRIPDENMSAFQPFKMPYLRERRPCKPVNGEGRITRNTPAAPIEKTNFSWEQVLARHPDKLAKVNPQPNSSPLTPPPSPPPPSLPTYAMLDVMRRMRDRQAGIYRQKSKSTEFYGKGKIEVVPDFVVGFTFDYDTKLKWMTPAMEEVARLRQKTLLQSSNESSKVTSHGTMQPLTRSRVAHLKRLGSGVQIQRDSSDVYPRKGAQKKKKSSSH